MTEAASQARSSYLTRSVSHQNRPKTTPKLVVPYLAVPRRVPRSAEVSPRSSRLWPHAECSIAGQGRMDASSTSCVLSSVGSQAL